MPATSKAKNPRGIEVEFEEASHIYRTIKNDKEIRYISGTTFLGNFFPQFDPTGEITKRCALKAGISIDELKKQWADKGKESCRLGTRTHELCEDIILGNKIRNIAESESENSRFKNASTLAYKLKNSIDILGVEKIVFSDRLNPKIAGTIDLFGRSRKTGEYLILDWKTNNEITQDNIYKKFCLYPISHIPDTNFYHYALQLSLYQFLLKFEGYVPFDAKFRRALLHVTEKHAKIIQCPDYTNEIKNMIIMYNCDS